MCIRLNKMLYCLWKCVLFLHIELIRQRNASSAFKMIFWICTFIIPGCYFKGVSSPVIIWLKWFWQWCPLVLYCIAGIRLVLLLYSLVTVTGNCHVCYDCQQIVFVPFVKSYVNKRKCNAYRNHSLPHIL